MRDRSGRRAWLGLVVVLGLLALALSVRLYRLHDLPPGLWRDEAANGVDVLDILRGRFAVFFERNTGREPLFIYLQALAVAFLGRTPFALRLVSAVIGSLTVPAFYWMTYEAFAGSASHPKRLALWTALFITFSYWHLNFSRLGLRVIMLPLAAAVVFALFWRAWRHIAAGEPLPWSDLILCGICTGLAQYTYIAARFIPVLLVVTSLAGVLVAAPGARRPRQVIQALLIIGGVAALVFAPLGAYFITHPGRFLDRAASVSIFSGASNEGSLRAVADALIQTAGLFGVAGDKNLRHNPAGLPAFDPVLGCWLAAGVVVALLRGRRLPYLFGLLWLMVFALPEVLTTDGIPHTLRGLGMLPGAYLLAVLAMTEAGSWLARRLAIRPHLALWLPLPFWLFSSVVGVQAYFTAWQPRARFDVAFSTPFVDIAPVLAQDPGPDTAWLLPYYNMGEPPIAADILAFLGVDASHYRLAQVNQGQAGAELAAATQGLRFVRLVDWPGSWPTWNGFYALGDPRRTLEFLLRKYGAPVGAGQAGSYTYHTYAVPYEAPYNLTAGLAPADLSFDGKIKLTGLAFGVVGSGEVSAGQSAAGVPAGSAAWAVLRWQALAPLDAHAKVSLYLTDMAGHVAGQVDDLLMNDGYPFYPAWQPGELAESYLILPTLSAIPTGDYELHVAVYDGATQQRYPVLDAHGSLSGTAAVAGLLRVVEPVTPQIVTPTYRTEAQAWPGTGLSLLGYGLGSGDDRSAGPGSTLPLTLYWRATGQPTQNYRADVRLIGDGGRVLVREQRTLANGEQKTSAWQAGETLRDWYDLAIPPDAPAGTYQLSLSLDGGGQAAGAAVELGGVTIAGRPHVMERPAVGRELPAKLGTAIGLLGYDAGITELAAGGSLDVTLYWQALRPVERSYTAFVHLLGPDGKVWGQQDRPPGGGELPTNSWVTGEYITDRYQVPLASAAPAGTYTVEAGMYDAETGTRLPVSGAQGEALGDHLLLPLTVQVTAGR